LECAANCQSAHNCNAFTFAVNETKQTPEQCRTNVYCNPARMSVSIFNCTIGQLLNSHGPFKGVSLETLDDTVELNSTLAFVEGIL
jgi:hypothetical protein